MAPPGGSLTLTAGAVLSRTMTMGAECRLSPDGPLIARVIELLPSCSPIGASVNRSRRGSRRSRSSSPLM